MRQYQATLAAHKAYACLCEYASIREEMAKNPSVLTFDKLQAPQVVSVNEYLHSRFSNGNLDEGNAHLEGRIRRLIDLYAQSGFAEGQRLVDLHLDFGMRLVRVLTLFRVAPDASYELADVAEDTERSGPWGVCTVLSCITELQSRDDPSLEVRPVAHIYIIGQQSSVCVHRSRRRQPIQPYRTTNPRSLLDGDQARPTSNHTQKSCFDSIHAAGSPFHSAIPKH